MSFVLELSRDDRDVRRQIFKTCAENNWFILELKTNVVSLEEVFKHLTT